MKPSPKKSHPPASEGLNSTPTRARRFASMMYEGVLLFAVVFLSDYLFDTLTQSKHGLALRSARQAWLFLAIGGYFLLCWARSGQTLPMKAWHIRLVDASGATRGSGLAHFYRDGLAFGLGADCRRPLYSVHPHLVQPAAAVFT